MLDNNKNKSLLYILTFVSVLAYLPTMVATFHGGLPFRRDDSDVIALFGAWRHFISFSFEQGILPLWNPHTFCGMPFLSNLQTSVFYPVNWLYNIFPFSFALLYDAVVHHVVLLCGAYTFARALRLNRSSALLVAIAWGLDGSISAHSNVGHSTWHAARAFMPWLLWALLCFLRTGRQRYIALFCAFIVLQIASGYPPMTLLSLALCAGLCMARVSFYYLRTRFENNPTSTRSSTRYSKNLHLWRVAALFLAVSGLVLCVWALPFLELSRSSVHGTALTYEAASRISGSWRSIARLLLPQYFGGNHYPQWSTPFTGAYEQIGYAGLYATLLALCSPWAWFRLRRSREINSKRHDEQSREHDSARHAIFWLYLLLPISIILSLGDSLPLHRWLYDNMPFFAKLRVPGRWIELWVVAVPLLAGYSNQYLVLPTLSQRQKTLSIEGTVEDIHQKSGKMEIEDGQSSSRCLVVFTAGAFILSCALAALTFATPHDVWVARIQYGLEDVFKIFTIKEVNESIDGLRLMAINSCITAALISATCYLFLVAMKTKRSSRSLLTPRRAYFGLLIILTFDLLNLYWASLTPAPARNYAQAVWPRSLVNKYDFGQRWVALGFFGDANVHLFSNIDAANGYDAMIGQNFTDYSLLVTSYLSRPYNDWFVPRRYNSLMKIAAVTHDVWRADARDDEAIAIHTHLQTAQKFGEWYLAEYKSTWPRFYVSRNIVETPREQQLAVLKNLTLGDFAQQHRPVVAEPRAFAVIDSPLQPQDRVLDASRTINTLTLSVSATQPSVLVAAESNFAGWKAWVNGKPTPIHDANYLFRGIEVPRGTSRVQMAYEPQTYRFGLFLSLCGLLISSAWLASWLASRNTKRTSATII